MTAFIIATIHINLCIGTLSSFAEARPDLASLLEGLLNFDICGEFMLTEVGHGLDVRNLETTATLQPDGSFDLRLAWYPTNYWAFWIICVLHIRQVRADYPDLRGDQVQLNGQAPESQTISEQLLELSTRILQSIEFHIQDEMKLYGAVSAALPFQTAMHLLRKNDGCDGLWSTMYVQVLDEIAHKGYQDMLRHEDHPFGYPRSAT